MRPNLKFLLNSIVVTSLTLVAGIPALALACELKGLEGTWSRAVSEPGLVETGTTTVWNIEGNQLTSTVQLTDDLTQTGTFGPYYESETSYVIALDAATCTLTGSATTTTERSFRVYEEPTPDLSVTVVQRPRSIKFRVTLSTDQSQATLNDGKDPAFTLVRSR